MMDRIESGLAAVLVAACTISAGPAPAMAGEESYRVEIASDVSPRMQAKDVAQVVATATARPIRGVGPGGADGEIRMVPSQPKILSVECMTLERLRGRFRSVAPVLDAETVWLVRVKATFFRFRPTGPPIVSDTQFFVVDDATGNILVNGVGL
jgi:hypothetical protein